MTGSIPLSQTEDKDENNERMETEKKIRERVSNQRILQVCALLFGLFVIAEMIGAIASNSLSLLGDAAAMSVDTFTYFTNMYAERLKEKNGVIDRGTRRVLEVYIPAFSASALLAVTAYIISDAVNVIRQGGEADDVNVYFLWAFSIVSVFVDLGSSIMFCLGGKDALTLQHYTPIEAGEPSVHHSSTPLVIPNLNMISALTHVGGDSLRTLAVFLAALVATVTDYDGSICDAVASIVVSISIIICLIPLLREILIAAFIRESEDLVLRPQVTEDATITTSV